MLANNAMATDLEIETALEKIGEVLTKNGFVVNDGDRSVIVMMGNPSNPIPAVVTCFEQQIQIVCQLTNLGAIGEDCLAEFGIKALDLNTQVAPFAVALISDENEANTWPIVLIDTIPSCDLQESELLSAFNALGRALPLAADLVGNQFRDPVCC